MKKKLIPLILTLVLMGCLLFPAGVSAASAVSAGLPPAQTYDNASSRSYQLLTDFVGRHPDRSVGTEGEKNAALYLAKFFYELGLQPYQGAAADFSSANPSEEYKKYLSAFSDALDWTGKQVVSNNVSAYLPAANATDHWVVVGAHYDDVYSFGSDGEQRLSHGAYDNGTGVAALLALAESLKGKSLSANVVFCAFGAEETGLYGSKAFVTAMQQKDDFNDILIMYNLDVVGPGDYLYLYTDDVKTEHGEYLHGVAEELPENVLRRPPKDKKLLYANASYDSLAYEHVGQMSDHASFYNAGANVAFFFSMNWDTYRKTGAVESVNHPAIMHTANDNLATVDAYYKDTYVKYMDAAVSVVSASLQKDDFVPAMMSAKENRANYAFFTNRYWLMLVGAIVLAVFIGVVLLIFFRAKKKAAAAPPPKGGEEGAPPKKEQDPFYVFGRDLDGSGGDDSVFGKELDGK